MSAVPKSSYEGAFGSDYWLGHCEGFRVDSHDGQIGIVEEVRPGSTRGDPETLIVRAGRFSTRLLIVPIGEIEEILVQAERVVLRASPQLVATGRLHQARPARI
jgi:hypothetical protein